MAGIHAIELLQSNLWLFCIVIDSINVWSVIFCAIC